MNTSKQEQKMSDALRHAKTLDTYNAIRYLEVMLFDESEWCWVFFDQILEKYKESPSEVNLKYMMEQLSKSQDEICEQKLLDVIEDVHDENLYT